jgi:hypothetical protein
MCLVLFPVTPCFLFTVCFPCLSKKSPFRPVRALFLFVDSWGTGKKKDQPDRLAFCHIVTENVKAEVKEVNQITGIRF